MGFGGAQGLHTASPGCKWRDLDWNRVVQLEGSQVLGVKFHMSVAQQLR